MLLMFELIVRVNKDVIKVGSIEIIKVVKEDVIYISLVSYRSISESKGNNLILVVAIVRVEYS